MTPHRPQPTHIYTALREAAEAYPEHTAFVQVETGDATEQPRSLSYAQMLQGITQVANGLRELGVTAQARVAFMLPSLPETQFLLWGAETAGVALPLNPLLSVDSLAHLLAAAHVRVLVCVGPSPQTNLWDKALQLRERCPELAWLVQLGGEPQAASPGVITWQRMLENQSREALSFKPSDDPQALAALFHTGGTTGSPRLVRQTHANQLASARSFLAMAQVRHSDVVANGFPLFHVAGAMVVGLAPLVCGATVVNMSAMGFRNPRMISEHWRIVERHRITIDGGVPTALSAMAAVPVAGADISSIRVGFSGGASVPRAAALAYEAATGKPLREIYGMTEAAGIISIDPVDVPRQLGSAGLPAPGTRCEVMRLGTGGQPESACAVGEVGVLVVHGPQVCPGYDNPAHNGSCFMADGGLITGDLARLSADGRIQLVGRSKDLIIRSGHNIDPVVIEEALLSHPAVAAAAAVGEPDAYAGELPVAYVVLKPGAAVSVDELQAFAREQVVERPAWPKRITFVDALPLTAVGKIYKPALRADATRRALTDELASEVNGPIEVIEDPQQGLLALIPRPTEASLARVEAALARYAMLRYRWA